ncbi:MAG TPA: hypothetical protein VD838_00800 [Anaeromyxobacteraceae bacterium]|nr:hypothetical protein [Anaeromyxobacteraceae bacterium]
MRTMGVVRVAAIGLLLASGGAALAADDGTVKVAKSPQHGDYLTDGKGMALYFFLKDSKGKSACTGQCVVAWPLFQAEKVTPQGEGLKAADFATISREDGQTQTTYQGKPLYYYVKDQKPGDTTGHGVKDVWILATP